MALLRKLVFGLLAVAVVDLVILIAIAHWIGFWPTVGISVAASLIGGWLVKREGRRIWREWREAGTDGRAPEAGVVDGMVVLGAGVAIMLPGLITDVAGAVALLPPVRRRIAGWLGQRLGGAVRISSFDLGSFDLGRLGGVEGLGAPPRVRASSQAAGRPARDREIAHAEIIEDVRRPSRAGT